MYMHQFTCFTGKKKKAQILTLRKLQAPRLLRPYLGESEAAVREVA
jgi:hypothetical protein